MKKIQKEDSESGGSFCKKTRVLLSILSGGMDNGLEDESLVQKGNMIREKNKIALILILLLFIS